MLQQTIYMDPPYDTMAFSPPALTDQQPALTLAQALSSFERQVPGFVAPPDSTFQLGRYTAAVGNGDYRFRDVLAWSIRYHECAQLRHVVDSVTSIPCTRWIFIDATTGEMMEAVYQH
jgi:hypothetical protein